MTEYTVIYEPGERNWSAYVPDLPGCIATAKNRKQLERRLQEGIEFHLEGLRLHATIEEVQANLPELLQQLSGDQELVIVADGKPVGRLLPAPLPKGVPIRGRGKGKLIVHVDDDEHLKDFAEYMP